MVANLKERFLRKDPLKGKKGSFQPRLERSGKPIPADAAPWGNDPHQPSQPPVVDRASSLESGNTTLVENPTQSTIERAGPRYDKPLPPTPVEKKLPPIPDSMSGGLPAAADDLQILPAPGHPFVRDPLSQPLGPTVPNRKVLEANASHYASLPRTHQVYGNFRQNQTMADLTNSGGHYQKQLFRHSNYSENLLPGNRNLRAYVPSPLHQTQLQEDQPNQNYRVFVYSLGLGHFREIQRWEMISDGDNPHFLDDPTRPPILFHRRPVAFKIPRFKKSMKFWYRVYDSDVGLMTTYSHEIKIPGTLVWDRISLTKKKFETFVEF